MYPSSFFSFASSHHVFLLDVVVVVVVALPPLSSPGLVMAVLSPAGAWGPCPPGAAAAASTGSIFPFENRREPSRWA
jgi:hypothetical protein